MAASSSAVKADPATACRFSSSCATLLAPISADVTRGSRSTQDSASCARVWPAGLRDLVERAQVTDRVLGQQVRRERLGLAGARPVGDAVQVAAGQHALGERRERDAAEAIPVERVEQAVVVTQRSRIE